MRKFCIEMLARKDDSFYFRIIVKLLIMLFDEKMNTNAKRRMIMERTKLTELTKLLTVKI